MQTLKNQKSSFLDVFPNPTHDVINIKTSHNIERVRIYDVNGRMIISKNLEGNKHFYAVDISGLGPAVYLIQIYTDQGVFTDKVLKME